MNDEEARFDDLLKRYLEGQLSPADKEKIDQWIDAMDKDADELPLSQQAQNALFDKIKQKIGQTPVLKLEPVHSRPFYLRPAVWLRAAAILVLTASSFYLATKILAPRAELTKSENGVEKVILNDGTLVWLKENSKISYYEDASTRERHARLQGEALFEVAKDPARPFAIHCGTIKITVLGTSFNLKADSNLVELMVLTGKVHVSSSTDKQEVEALPLQKIIYAPQQKVMSMAMSEAEIATATANTQYKMLFTNASMNELVNRIEEKFDVSVTFENKTAGNCLITADFTDQSLENTLKMVSEVLDIKYIINRNSVVIGGNGCQENAKP